MQPPCNPCEVLSRGKGWAAFANAVRKGTKGNGERCKEIIHRDATCPGVIQTAYPGKEQTIQELIDEIREQFNRPPRPSGEPAESDVAEAVTTLGAQLARSAQRCQETGTDLQQCRLEQANDREFFQEEKDKIQAQLRECLGALDPSREENQRLGAQIAALQTRSSEQVAQLEQQLNEALGKVRDATEAHAGDIADVQQSLAESRQSLAESKQQASNALKDNEALQQQLEQVKRGAESIRQKLQQAEDNAQLQKAQLQQSNAEFNETLMAQKTAETSLRQQVAELSEALAQAQEETASENQQLQAQLADATRENRRLQEETGRLQDDNRRLQEEAGRLQDDNRRIQEETGRLQDDNRRIQEDMHRLQEERQTTEAAYVEGQTTRDAEIEAAQDETRRTMKTLKELIRIVQDSLKVYPAEAGYPRE